MEDIDNFTPLAVDLCRICGIFATGFYIKKEATFIFWYHLRGIMSSLLNRV